MSDEEPLVCNGPKSEWTHHRTAGTDVDPTLVENLRRKLKYFFMSPCQKYRARGRKPWKLMLQFLKIVIITVQLISFGLSNEMMVTFKEQNLMAFRHLFLKNYQDSDDPDYAVYTKHDVHDHIQYMIRRYLNLQNLTAGNHALEKIDGMFTPLSVCQELYRHADISPSNETFDIDPHVDTECISIYPTTPYKNDSLASDMNLTIDFQSLLAVNIYFKVKAINLQTVRHQELPDCYDFNINIMFDNHAHSGKIPISLSSDVQIKGCKNWNVSGSMSEVSKCLQGHSEVLKVGMKLKMIILIVLHSDIHFMLIVVFDCVVICACLLSLALCTRSVFTGIFLQFEYTAHVLIQHSKSVSWSERLEFINGWYILIIISDTLTVAGSVLKICIQSKELTNYDECSILLGTATMLVWIGVMRYLSFFQKYYILILTLRAALPNVIRFSLCAVMIYLSYCFCGWIVLGPHHENFRTFNMAADCLFAMINGDEIYSTFTKLREKNYLVWVFSGLYVYTFIPLFTYMVLSLFIAIITETYETIKHYQKDGAAVSELRAFIAECRDSPDSGKYVMDEETSSFCCFCAACT